VLASGDPESDLAHWVKHGTPAGILDPVLASGIFPRVEPDADIVDPDSLAPSLLDWENYASVEDEPDIVWGLLDEHIRLGFVEVFDSIEAAEKALGAPLVPSRLGMVTKARPDGSLKYRLIWDFRASDHNRAVVVEERVVLPGLEDVIVDVLYLAESLSEGETVRFLVLDIANAFHHLPLRPHERRFHVAIIGGKVVAYRVLVFGSKASPTLWGRAGAWVGRSMAGIRVRKTCRAEIYVDDPLLAVKGTEAEASE